MRLFLASIPLLLAVIVTGCSKPETVMGRWDCLTTHTGGFLSNDIFEFSKQGTLTLNSDGQLIHGSFTKRSNVLAITLTDVPVPKGAGPNPTQQQSLTATIKKLEKNKLEMDIATGNNHHLSRCRR